MARLEPIEQSTAQTVVLSAHQDSVNQWNPWFGESPGADDNGSGSATIFEALRVILAGGVVPSRPLEFHWYSAEEAGLLGSQKVVASYIKQSRDIYAVYHNDMTGYLSDDTKNPAIGIVTDYVNQALVPTIEMLADAYSGISWVHTTCGYACSDHASWTKAGVPSAFTFEGPFEKHSPFIHTTKDTVEHINFDHMAAFCRVVVGFAIEMSYA